MINFQPYWLKSTVLCPKFYHQNLPARAVLSLKGARLVIFPQKIARSIKRLGTAELNYYLTIRDLEQCTKVATVLTSNGLAQNRWKTNFRNLREFCPTQLTSFLISRTQAKVSISGFSKHTLTFCKTGDLVCLIKIRAFETELVSIFC